VSALLSATKAPEPAWDQVIRSERRLLEIPWRELWKYRDLVSMFAQRDVSASYKQTVLGPFWYVLQPLLVTAVFSYLFGRMGRFGTSDVPHYLFYMSGLVPWAFFADTVNKTSTVFTTNANLFNKVWFPRLCVPLAGVLTNLVPLLVQICLFLVGFAFYLAKNDPHIHPNWRIIIAPLVFVQLAALGLGIGLIVSALTRRFRDLLFGVKVGLQLWMFGSAVVFPLSRIANDNDRTLFFLNPVVPAIESIRYAFFGVSLLEPWHVAVSVAVSAAVLFFGIALFNRAEQTAMDTV
jgi:lipopolysaccharide transport system permease protein